MEKGEKKGHLTQEERNILTILHAQKVSIRKMAEEIGRSPSTVSRELNRKEAVFYRGNYVGSQTHGNAKRKWKATHEWKKINNKQIQKIIEIGLKGGYSPENIAGRLRTKYDFKIHHETIYQYIYKERTDLAQYLLRRPFGRKPRKRRTYKPMKSRIPNRTDIDYRCIEANERLEFGHFECDSVESANEEKKEVA